MDTSPTTQHLVIALKMNVKKSFNFQKSINNLMKATSRELFRNSKKSFEINTTITSEEDI